LRQILRTGTASRQVVKSLQRVQLQTSSGVAFPLASAKIVPPESKSWPGADVRNYGKKTNGADP
jgi:hypothetical protein